MGGEFTRWEEIRDVYDKRASFYGLAVHGRYLLSFPIGRNRRLVIDASGPQPGDSVVEIGCGTGMNFLLLEQNIGPRGRIIDQTASPQPRDTRVIFRLYFYPSGAAG